MVLANAAKKPRFPRRLLGIACLLIGSFSAASAQSLQLEIAQQTSYKSGSVVIDAVVINTTQQSITVPVGLTTGYTRLFSRIQVKNGDGTDVPLSEYGHSNSAPAVFKADVRVIPPGEAIAVRVPLSKLFVMDHPGTYFVGLSFSDPLNQATPIMTTTAVEVVAPPCAGQACSVAIPTAKQVKQLAPFESPRATSGNNGCEMQQVYNSQTKMHEWQNVCEKN
jgi:hypothetical protein